MHGYLKYDKAVVKVARGHFDLPNDERLIVIGEQGTNKAKIEAPRFSRRRVHGAAADERGSW